MAAIITAAVLYSTKVVSNSSLANDIIAAAIYMGGFLGVPGLFCEFVVREKKERLKNVLLVMGCDIKAYWLGTFIADYLLLMILTAIMWISWPAAGMSDFYTGDSALNFLVVPLFNAELLAFSYFFSTVFETPQTCISVMPVIIIIFILIPDILLLLGITLANALGKNISQGVVGGVLQWGILITTPHGALLVSMLNTTQNLSQYISSFPPIYACFIIMTAETIG